MKTATLTQKNSRHSSKSFREQKISAQKHRAQTVALNLFEKRGFENVSVEEIASAAELSPATIYRYFKTKEGIVLWEDENESRVGLLKEALTGASLVNSLLVFAKAFDALPDNEKKQTPRLILMTLREPKILGAALINAKNLRNDIAHSLAHQNARAEPNLEDKTAALAALSVLISALLEWVREKGSKPLVDCMRMALAAVQKHFS